MSWSRFIPNGVSCFFTFLLWDGPAIYFLGGGGGLAKEKQSHAQEKKEKILVQKEAWETVYASLTYFWDLYNRNVWKEILIFLIVFEWKVLNSHNFDLPGINNQLQKCWDTPTKNRPFLLQIAPGHMSVRNNTDLLPPSQSKLFLQVLSMVLYC